MTPDTTPERRLLLVQAGSGVLFATFLLVHLANQAVAVLGPERYDALQSTLRHAYQAPVVELALVLAPLLVHAVAGALRLAKRVRAVRQSSRLAHPEPVSLSPSTPLRTGCVEGPRIGESGRPATSLGLNGEGSSRRITARPPWRTRLHRWSGVVLLIFFVGHVAATRGASAVGGVFPGFEGVAFTLTWVPAYFWPYYTALALAGLYHLVNGLGVGLAVLGVAPGAALRRPAILGALVGVGSVALVLGVLAFGGAFFDVGHPERGAYAQWLVKLGVAHPNAPVAAPAAPSAAR